MSSRPLQIAVFWMGVLLVTSTRTARATEPEGELTAEEKAYENCPIAPVSGNWGFEAGQMALSGVQMPGMGGGEGVVPVWVDCEKGVLTVEMGGQLGRVNFYPSQAEPPVIPGAKAPEMLVNELETILGPVKQVAPEVSAKMFPGFKLGLVVEDERARRLLSHWIRVHNYTRESLLEPPEELKLSELRMFRAVAVKEAGYELVWYLWVATQYEMYSMTNIETVQGPMHQQFHHWNFRSPFSED